LTKTVISSHLIQALKDAIDVNLEARETLKKWKKEGRKT